MNRETLIEIVSSKLKLIRTEHEYTQDKMAEIIGLSKKTLVQIEKGRVQAGWTNTVAICTLFRDSEILTNTLGDDPIVIIQTVAFDSITHSEVKTLGGKIWWRDVESKASFKLQQNVISQHFRILNETNYRVYSSFDQDVAEKRLKELADIKGKPSQI